ncbi:PAAR domain-containing protein [Faucicola boevrei]|uniref:PAAR domain-containing protein n=1 Tax=Faucicola boevrei TaxID=346665 RepID=UPI000371B5E8|nr:PAAR domain-containing protein [Moraxella boevrei]
MPLTRYYILENDTTTAGGVVQTTTNPIISNVSGKKQSCIGDDVWCPACQSMGQIIPTGPRLSFSLGEAMPALNDDLCLCKCNPPPKLINSQTNFKEIIDDNRLAQYQQAREQYRQSFAGFGIEEIPTYTLLVLVDDFSNPLKNCFYSIKFDDGEILFGHTDDDGRTQEFLANKTISNIRYQINQGLSDE